MMRSSLSPSACIKWGKPNKWSQLAIAKQELFRTTTVSNINLSRPIFSCNWQISEPHFSCSNRICLPGDIYLLLTSQQHVFSLCRGTNSRVLPKCKMGRPQRLQLWKSCSFPSTEGNTKSNGWGLATKVTCICLGTLLFLREIPFFILACMENSTFDVAEEALFRLSFTLLWGIWAWSKVALLCASTGIFHIFIQFPIYFFVVLVCLLFPHLMIVPFRTKFLKKLINTNLLSKSSKMLLPYLPAAMYKSSCCESPTDND